MEGGGVGTIIDTQLKPGDPIATGRRRVPQPPGRPDPASEGGRGAFEEKSPHDLFEL
jgi:hypothetical protein